MIELVLHILVWAWPLGIVLGIGYLICDTIFDF